MTPDEFQAGMQRLEKIFNAGIELGEDLRGEYFEALQYVRADVYQEAVQYVVDTFRPFMSEPFPTIGTVESAIMETRDRASEDAGWEARRRPAPDTRAADFCQRCGNLGLYLAEDGQARFCACEKGRMKRASWGTPIGARKRDEKIQKALEKVPPSLGPVRGLQEWNPLGFWEDTQAEHDRWMAAKREQIAELECRRAQEPEKKPSPSDELRFKSLKETVARIKFGERFPAQPGREPGEDEEDEDVVAF